MTNNQRRRFAGNAHNLLPFQFQFLPEEVHKEISRKGGVASGKRRREKAEALDIFNDAMILSALRNETRAHFREAIRRYAKEEAQKRRRRRKSEPDE